MIVFPNAKINIGLSIINKRTDGFHSIESIFYPIDWHDILEIIPSDIFEFKSTGISIPGDLQKNVCIRAYQLLKNDFDIPPVKIHLHKIIPIGAGLGGGSSDAAFTLKLLNELFELNLTSLQLINYAQKIGSDCAFFIDNRPTFAFDKGDQFEAIDLDLSGIWIKLIYPNLHISTSEAYSGVVPNSSQYNLRSLNTAFIHEWKLYVKNDFEKSIFSNYPLLEQIKEDFIDQGALYSSMSGSGSTVYALFGNEPTIEPNSKIILLK